MSVRIQYQSAKLGIVTGKSLPEILGERLGDAGRFMFFMQAEVIAIATDLAEVIGGAISLKLLFGLPLFVGGSIIGAVSTMLLIFEKGATHRIFEKLIIGLLLVITFGFIAGLISFIPYVGSIVGFLLSIGIAFAQFDSLMPILQVVLVFVTGQFLEGNFLTPKLVGENVGLHPVWVMFALLAGGVLLGFLGLMIAVPLAAVIGDLLRHAIENYKKSTHYLDS